MSAFALLLGENRTSSGRQDWLDRSRMTLSGPATVAERIAIFKVDLDGRVSNAMLFQSLRQEWGDAFYAIASFCKICLITLADERCIVTHLI